MYSPAPVQVIMVITGSVADTAVHGADEALGVNVPHVGELARERHAVAVDVLFIVVKATMEFLPLGFAVTLASLTGRTRFSSQARQYDWNRLHQGQQPNDQKPRMPAPRPEGFELARRGARVALERLTDSSTTREVGEDSLGRIAAVEALWRVRLLVEKISFPGETWKPLHGDGGEQDESGLVNAMRQLRTTMAHKILVDPRHKHAPARLGTNIILG